MAGRTSDQADLGLNLYRTTVPLWATFFTTNPSSDSPTGHGGIEWGPPRKRIHFNSAAGSPYWGEPEDLDAFVRRIRNNGSVQWLTVTLTVSPSVLLGVGFFNDSVAGTLRTWYPLTAENQIQVVDGQSYVVETLGLSIEGD